MKLLIVGLLLPLLSTVSLAVPYSLENSGFYTLDAKEVPASIRVAANSVFQLRILDFKNEDIIKVALEKMQNFKNIVTENSDGSFDPTTQIVITKQIESCELQKPHLAFCPVTIGNQ